MMGLEELTRELDRLGKTNDYAPEMLKAASPILEDELKAQVRNAANRGYATGTLESSISANEPHVTQGGYSVSVTAKGKDKKKVRNNEKLAYLNYGTSRQQAQPVISKAIDKAEDKCIEAMQKKFDEVTG